VAFDQNDLEGKKISSIGVVGSPNYKDNPSLQEVIEYFRNQDASSTFEIVNEKGEERKKVVGTKVVFKATYIKDASGKQTVYEAQSGVYDPTGSSVLKHRVKDLDNITTFSKGNPTTFLNQDLLEIDQDLAVDINLRIWNQSNAKDLAIHSTALVRAIERAKAEPTLSGETEVAKKARLLQEEVGLIKDPGKTPHAPIGGFKREGLLRSRIR
jgi:hypothetical protein